jgi:hypothetical protein
MNNTTLKEKQKTTQVIGCRVEIKKWHQLEIKCIEKQIPISQVLQKAVNKFIATN